MPKLLVCLSLTTAILWIVGVYVVAMDCVRRDKQDCVAMAVLWPVTIPIAYSGR